LVDERRANPEALGSVIRTKADAGKLTRVIGAQEQYYPGRLDTDLNS
jgi:hypothetical protein